MQSQRAKAFDAILQHVMGFSWDPRNGLNMRCIVRLVNKNYEDVIGTSVSLRQMRLVQLE